MAHLIRSGTRFSFGIADDPRIDMPNDRIEHAIGRAAVGKQSDWFRGRCGLRDDLRGLQWLSFRKGWNNTLIKCLPHRGGIPSVMFCTNAEWLRRVRQYAPQFDVFRRKIVRHVILFDRDNDCGATDESVEWQNLDSWFTLGDELYGDRKLIDDHTGSIAFDINWLSRCDFIQLRGERDVA